MTKTTIKQNNLKKTIKILMQLDAKSLLLIDSGAKLLAARQEMDNGQKKELQEVEMENIKG